MAAEIQGKSRLIVPADSSMCITADARGLAKLKTGSSGR